MLFGQQGKEKNEAFWLAKHKEIIDNYKPDIIYQDFNLHIISQSVLLEFLSYYYNKAAEWNKEVVATFKDGLNKKCAVLDYERGGPPDITDNYWLTDDAISSSSWCYTEGIGYYSKKQILHAFIRQNKQKWEYDSQHFSKSRWYDTSGTKGRFTCHGCMAQKIW